MIRISYDTFMPNSGNASLDSVQNKLQQLFLADDKIVLEETGEEFDSSQKEVLAENIMQHWATCNDNDSSNNTSQKRTNVLESIGWGFLIISSIFLFYIKFIGPHFQFRESSIPGTYVYHDAIGTKYTLILYSDKTASITERWTGDSELAKELSGRKGKGSWYKVSYEGTPYINIDMTNGASLYIRGDYIYTSYRAMKAKDYNNGFPISKK